MDAAWDITRHFLPFDTVWAMTLATMIWGFIVFVIELVGETVKMFRNRSF